MAKKKSADKNKPEPVVQAVAYNSKAWNITFTVSLIVVFVLMTIMSFSYGLSGDEVDMNEYGKAILKYFTSFGENDLVFNMPKEYDRDGVILYYGGFFDLVCAIFNQFSPFEEYTTRHILNAWAGFIAILFSGKIVNLITDKRWGTLAIWVMFLSPFFLGHAMNNPKDLPLATGYIASVYFIIRFFERLPAVGWTDYLWVILSIGLTINIRVAGILLIPYLFVYATFQYFATRKNNKDFEYKLYFKPLVIISVLGYLVGSLFWPYGLQNPISNPLNALSVMSDFKVNLGQIWEGEKVFSGQLPKNYLLKSFFITNTFAVIAGLLFFFLFIRQSIKSNAPHIIYFVAFTAFFPLFYIIYKGSNVYHAWRHVLFIFPSIIVLVALGWSYLNSFSIKAYEKNGVGLAVGSLLLLEPIIFIAGTFPNTITYYNAFAGGVKGAYGNYEMDYYYNSVKQCTDYFETEILPTLPKDKKTILYSNAFHLMYQYLNAYDSVVQMDYIRYYEKDMKDWDYAIFHMALVPLNEIQNETWINGNVVYVAEVKGKPLCVLVRK